MNSSEKAARQRKEHNNRVIGTMVIEKLMNAGLNEEEVLKVLLENMYEVLREKGIPEEELKQSYIDDALEEFRKEHNDESKKEEILK